MTSIQPERSYMDPKEVRIGSEREAWPGGPPAITRTKDGSRPHRREAEWSKHWHRRSTDGSGSEREAGLDVERLYGHPPRNYENGIGCACGWNRDGNGPGLWQEHIAAALRSAAPTGATPDPSIPELLATLEVGPDPVYWNGYRDGKAAALGSIPERPAEPLREALTTILALAEGEAPLLEHYRREIERVARAALALQSTPESRPLTCHADGSPCDICAILVGKESRDD